MSTTGKRSSDIYDEQLHVSYEAGRRLGDHTLAQWMEVVAPFISPVPSARILDLGAGAGRFTAPLADSFGAHVIAVEPSEKMRRLGRDPVSAAGAVYVGARAEQLPFVAVSFDVVFASMVLHHLPELTRVGAELARVIRRGGRILIRNSFRGRLEAIPYHHFFPGAKALDETRLPSIEEVTSAFSASGLNLIGQTVVRQQIDPNLASHLERLRLRALSTLALLPDCEFEEGIQRLERAVREDRDQQSVCEDIDLIVFEKPR